MTSVAKNDSDLALQLQLQQIVHRDERRKQLIHLCVMKAAYLRQISGAQNGAGAGNGTGAQVPSQTPQIQSNSSESPSQAATDSDPLSKKVQNFELQVTSLKMTLATKEHAHAAKVEELKEEIERLKKEKSIEESVQRSRGTSASLARGRKSRVNPRVFNAGSPPSKTTQSMSSFFAPSPFADSKSGRGNSFSSAGLTSIASKATLKLSRAKPNPADDVFSPNNSSTESTPKKSRKNSEVGGVQGADEGDLSDTLRVENAKVRVTETENARNSDSTFMSDEPEKSQNEFSGMSLNTTASDGEEVYHSANASFESENGSRPKKRKIRLVSSEASKLLLASQDTGLDGEADLNSLKYYQDENFDVGATSPLPVAKAKAAPEQPPKKKHVFRIG